MGNVLVIAEHRKGQIKKTSLSAVTAGKMAAETLNSECYFLLMGSGVSDLAQTLGAYGVNKVLVADSDALEHLIAESCVQVISGVAKEKDASFIMATATAWAKDFMPRIAARLNVGMASDVIAITIEGGETTFKRAVYGANAEETISVEGDTKVVTVRGTAFEPAEAGEGSCDVEEVKVDIDTAALGAKFVSFDETISERPELTDAEVIVSGGRGMKGPEGFKQLDELADIFNAAIGATRAAVDNEWVPNDLQVGQTGKIVAPGLYFAFGISGAIQHLAGMKDSKVIVAVNKDEEAPIFQVADYGIVADLFKVLPELTEKIKQAKAG